MYTVKSYTYNLCLFFKSSHTHSHTSLHTLAHFYILLHTLAHSLALTRAQLLSVKPSAKAQIDVTFSALLFICSIACLSQSMFCNSHTPHLKKKHLSSAWTGNCKQPWQTVATWHMSQCSSIRAAQFFGGHLELYFIYIVLLNLIFICSCKLPE